LGPRTSIPEGATVLIAIILSREQPGLLGLITLRGLRLVPPQFRPALHRWRARGPPEDYGGPGAYGSLPPALADPINQEQAEHPEAFDPAAKNGALGRAAAEVGTWLFPLLVCVVRAGLRIGEVLALRPDEPVTSSLGSCRSTSVFTNRVDVALRAAERLDAATVLINDHTAFRSDWMPFAGRKQSGYGIGGIPWTMHEMTHHKMLVFRR